MEVKGLKGRESLIKKNWTLSLFNGIITSAPAGFVNTSTIIPTFIYTLTPSKWVIGLISGLEGAGWFLPQFFIANIIEPLPKKKWLYDIMTYFRVGFFLLAGLVVLLSYIQNRFLILLLFTLFMALYYLTSGVAAIPFLSITHDTIPPERRGSLWAYRIFFGSILISITSLIVKPILKHWHFPTNYSILFFLAGVIFFIGFYLFSLSWEPRVKSPPPKRPLPSYIKETIDIIKGSRDYRAVLYMRLGMGVWGLSAPFYVIFATTYLKFDKSNVGILFAVSQIGTIVLTPLWGWISDHKGNRLVLIGCSLSGFLVPVLPLIAYKFQQLSIIFIYLVFFLFGIMMGGSWMGYTNYVMEISPPKRIPIYLGFTNTFIGLTMLLSPIGGLIADLTNLQTLFIISFIGGLIMLYLSVRLREPREYIVK
ncbi:MAG: MFS transporter [bacterium]